jgi:group I intron endonuclease
MATILTDRFNKIPICGIYKITNTINGKSYVGQSVNIKRRWSVYNGVAKRGIPRAINTAIGKYGKDLFVFEIIEQCDRSLLNDMECIWIKELQTMAPNGYNLSSGGLSPTSVSDETRKLQSLSKIGKKRGSHTEEHKMKISLAHTGVKLSEEHKKSLSNAKIGVVAKNKGKKMSQESIDKMVATKTGKPAFWRRKSVVRSDGAVYDSITIAAQQNNVDRATIHKNLNGSLKTVHKYTFSYGGQV